MNILETKNLIKIYGGVNQKSSTKALNGVDLEIKEGDFVGIMGPSGSGKTTLLNLLAGIDKATSGNVILNNTNIAEMKKDELNIFRRKNYGIVYQDFNLLDSLSIKENIILPMILENKSDDYMDKKALELVKYLGIEDIVNRYPYNVSGGQQQRASIARALVNDPVIILADEPTGSLDSKASTSIMNSFKSLNKENKSSIVMVTHDPFTASFCDRIIFIKDGLINMEINRKDSDNDTETRKDFFKRILDCQAIIGGELNDI